MDSNSLFSSPSLTTSPSNVPLTSTTPILSTGGICVRAVTIVSLIAVCIWANYEASKGFDLTIHNAPTDTLAGRRFDLMFVSNGKAATMLLKSSNTIEKILYPSHLYVKKPVSHVILELAGKDATEIVRVERGYRKENPGEYLILLEPEILEEENAAVAMQAALYRAMAYVWLWDGTNVTKRGIVDAMVEYLMTQSGFDSTSGKDRSSSVGNFMQKCENRSKGFVARLNNAVHELQSERMVDDQVVDQLLEEVCLEHLQLVSF